MIMEYRVWRCTNSSVVRENNRSTYNEAGYLDAIVVIPAAMRECVNYVPPRDRFAGWLSVLPTGFLPSFPAIMNDGGELTASAAAAATEAATEETPPDVQLAAQQIPVPKGGGKEGQAALTAEYPVELVGAVEEDVGSAHASVGSAPLAPPPTPNPSRELGKIVNDGETAAAAETSSTTASSASASATASRTICLRTLRGANPSMSSRSSLDAWGGTVSTAAAPDVVEQGNGGCVSPPSPPPPGAAAPGQACTTVAGVVGGGFGVLPTVSKVVDLREVKKVKPGPLAASSAAAPVPADDSDGFEEESGGGGSVKVDISVGKRMIEFQLNQNAAEEKREAARIKSERDRAGACRVLHAGCPGAGLWGAGNVPCFSFG